MASFFTCLHFLFCCWCSPQTALYHPSLKNLDPDMTKKSETRPLCSGSGNSVRSVLLNVCFYLCEVVRKVIHHCMHVTELLNMNMFLCTRETVVMTGKMKNRALDFKEWPEHHETWNREIGEMATIFDKTVNPQITVMIRSDQMAVAEVLLSDWLECQSEEQYESGDGKTEWNEEEDWSDVEVSEMSSENRELWDSFLNNSDPYNPFHFSCPPEDKVKSSDRDHHDDVEEPVPPCPQEKDETEWSEEEDSDWSDEGDLEMSAESRELWESFNNDPYNPLYFSVGVEIKASEIQQNHMPSSSTASEDEEHNSERSTKERSKVRFSEEVTIHYLEAWDCESQAARDGSCWMELARDRERFRRRVEKTGEIISPCLTAQNRARVLDRLLNHSDGILAVQ